MVTTVHIWSDTESVTLVLGVHTETELTGWIFSAAKLNMCVNHQHFRICSFFVATSVFEALSAGLGRNALLCNFITFPSNQ